MRFLITGIGGFVGAHLAEHLLAAGHDVCGTITGRPDRPTLRALAARHPRFDPATLVCADLGDRAALARAVAAVAPDGVFHLAGMAFAPRAADDWERAFAVNALGTMHVLEAVRAGAPASRVLVVTSSDVYGATAADELPIDEETPLRPVSVYGLTKATADLAAFRAWWETGQTVVRARAFNHTGPGQSPEFVCSDFARQIARIERGETPPELHVGNLQVARDFSDVRDVARGYALLWERGVPGAAYNLCSGVATPLARVVDVLLAAAGVPITIVPEAARRRRREIPTIVGAAARAAALGWRPRIPLERTLGDLLDDWRRRLAAA